MTITIHKIELSSATGKFYIIESKVHRNFLIFLKKLKLKYKKNLLQRTAYLRNIFVYTPIYNFTKKNQI